MPLLAVSGGVDSVGAMTPGTWRWNERAVDARRAVIFDIDGVLADASHRQEYLRGPEPDWRSFYERGVHDDPVDAMVALVGALRDDQLVVMLSARPMWAQEDTIRWFRRHGVRWDLLIMREIDSPLDAPSFKARSVRELRAAGITPTVAFDDDPRNVAMFEGLEVPCIYVHSGYYGVDHL